MKYLVELLEEVHESPYQIQHHRLPNNTKVVGLAPKEIRQTEQGEKHDTHTKATR